jgi:hypothetical protein
VSKRPQSESTALLKRQRVDEGDPSLQELVVAAPDAASNKGALIQTVKRTSGLTAPIMCLRVSSRVSLPVVVFLGGLHSRRSTAQLTA